jgi:hypothetical protein
MNERIESFVKECAIQEWTSVHGKSYRFEPGQLDKFAELIVKECAEVLTAQAHAYDAMPGREVSAQTMETGASLLLARFGVAK